MSAEKPGNSLEAENVRLRRQRNQAVDEVGRVKADNARLRVALETILEASPDMNARPATFANALIAGEAALAQESNSQKREHAQDERDGVST